jgi:hypothetical protein
MKPVASLKTPLDNPSDALRRRKTCVSKSSARTAIKLKRLKPFKATVGLLVALIVNHVISLTYRFFLIGLAVCP